MECDVGLVQRCLKKPSGQVVPQVHSPPLFLATLKSHSHHVRVYVCVCVCLCVYNTRFWITVHILLKPGLENFEHYFASM